MSLVPVKDGKCLVWDATCSDTLCSTYVSGTASTAESAANARETEKFAHYTDLMTCFDFRPLGFETFGPAGTEAKKVVNFIGKLLQEKTGEKRSTQFLWQRLSVEVQRGNAISVLETVPPSRGFDEIFYVLEPVVAV